MTSRARRRSDYQMTLFPFLAVLICTVGALVVLLVVVVQQARSSSGSAPDGASLGGQPQSGELDQHRQEAEDLQWQADALQTAHEATQAELKARQSQLAHLEEHIQRLKAQMRELVEQQSKREAELDEGTELAQLKARLDASYEQLNEGRRKLADAEQAAREQPPAYAIVPYTGPSGTTRRPIYVECLADRVVLRPEGIELVAEDFEPPQGPGNPLASVLRATADYWASRRDERSGRPYPLLLVRPSGAESYAACRAALNAWQAEFGYELVPASMELSYPEADAELRERLVAVLKDVRQRQALMREALAQRGGSVPTALRPSRDGGFEIVHSPSDTNINSPRVGGRAGARSGLGSTSAGAATDLQGELSANSGRDRAGSAAANRGGRRGGTRSHGGAGNAIDGDDSSNGLVGGPGGPGGTLGTAAGTSGGENPGAHSGATAGESHGASSGARDGAISGAPGGPNSDAPGGPNSGAPGGAASGAPGGTSLAASGGTPGSPGSPGTAGPQMESSVDPMNPATAHLALDLTGDSRPSAQSMRESSHDRSSATPRRALAETRGANWALLESASGAVGLRRPVRVRVRADEIVLLADPGTRQTHQVIPMLADSTRSIDQLVTALRARMRSWGLAGNGSYWVPQLILDVDARGASTADQIERLLSGSGLEVTRKSR